MIYRKSNRFLLCIRDLKREYIKGQVGYQELNRLTTTPLATFQFTC
jgi:hypothetical protein